MRQVRIKRRRQGIHRIPVTTAHLRGCDPEAMDSEFAVPGRELTAYLARDPGGMLTEFAEITGLTA